jgi:hypothetical protein
MDLREIKLEGMDWIHLAHDKGWWLALVNTNEPLGSIKDGNFLTSSAYASQEEFCSMELVNKLGTMKC